MHISKIIYIICTLLLEVNLIHAQNIRNKELINNNQIFNHTLKTVQLHPTNKPGQFPILNLNSEDELCLSFDILNNEIKDLYICIEHFNADWTKSNVPSTQYVSSYNEARIIDYRPSIATIQPYVHYKIKFPNENLKPIISGNFLLKVYEDADKNKLLLTRRFYVINQLAHTQAHIVTSPILNQKKQYQKLNITIHSEVSNSTNDFEIHVFQNQRSDMNQIISKPSYVGNNQFVFNDINTLDFLGNNGFRFIDIRTLYGASARVERVVQDSTLSIVLFTDESNSNLINFSPLDQNGSFLIGNNNIDEMETRSDYLNVFFSLQTDQKINGNIYLVGGFNDYQCNDSNKLIFNKAKSIWSTQLQLKQGIYEYEYVVQDTAGKTNTDQFSGSYFETNNEYQILVYLRKSGNYWDQIIGYKTISTNNINQP